MTRQRLLFVLAAPALIGLSILACESESEDNRIETPDGSINVGVDGSTSFDGAVPVIDSGTDSGSDAGSCRSALTLWDGGPMVVPTPYRELADSPFLCLPHPAYFHVANFEGDSGLPPGTTGPGAKAGVSSITDSVDGDDGFPDGAPPEAGSTQPCVGCQSWFSGSIDFSFDEVVLGGLPTHAGLVWTDDAVNAPVTFTAYGSDGGVIATQVVTGIGSPGISGETDEDRFFGVVYPGGVKRITLSHVGGGYEIDHLQIGR